MPLLSRLARPLVPYPLLSCLWPRLVPPRDPPTRPPLPYIHSPYAICSIHHNTSSPFILPRRSINPGHPPHFRYPSPTHTHASSTHNHNHDHNHNHNHNQISRSTHTHFVIASPFVLSPALGFSLSPYTASFRPPIPPSCSGGRISTTRTTTTGQESSQRQDTRERGERARERAD